MAMDSDYASSGEVETGYGPMFLILLACVLLTSAIAGLVVHSISDEKVNVYFRITVSRSCLDLDGKYQDIRLGKAVNVFNRANELLGVGRLEVQFSSKNKCDYAALFTIKRSNDRTYKIGTGSENRGKLKFSDESIVNLQQGRTLVVSASLD